MEKTAKTTKLGRTEVTATELQREILMQLARSTQVPYSQVVRAKIILGACAGKSNGQIGSEVGCHQNTASTWRCRWGSRQPVLEQSESESTPQQYKELIESALADEARSGSPPTFTAEQLCQIMAVACQPPEQVNCPVTHWTAQEFVNEVIKQDIVTTISVRHIGRFLKGMRPETTSVTVLADQ